MHLSSYSPTPSTQQGPKMPVSFVQQVQAPGACALYLDVQRVPICDVHGKKGELCWIQRHPSQLIVRRAEFYDVGPMVWEVQEVRCRR